MALPWPWHKLLYLSFLIAGIVAVEQFGAPTRWCAARISHRISPMVPFHPSQGPRVPWEAQLAADGHGVFLLPAVAAALYLADAQGEGSPFPIHSADGRVDLFR